MKQVELSLNTPVCSYCGLEVRRSSERWYHIDWTAWRLGQPRLAREHAFHCELSYYSNIVVVTESEFRIKQVESVLDKV